MPQYWSRQTVGKVVDSVINYEYKESIMRVADWMAPRDIAPEGALTLRLEMIPQLRNAPNGGRFVAHKYRLFINSGCVSSSVEVPAEPVEKALADGACVITAAITATDEITKAVGQMARPLAAKFDEIAQLLAEANAGMAAARATQDPTPQPTP